MNIVLVTLITVSIVCAIYAALILSADDEARAARATTIGWSSAAASVLAGAASAYLVFSPMESTGDAE